MFYSVFVGRIPMKATKEELVNLFSAHRPKEVVILKKDDSAVYSYGFVRFDNPQAAIDVIKEGDWKLRGCTLTLEFSTETKEALRRTMTTSSRKSAAVERDNMARSKLKEACKLINKEVDIINEGALLDSQVVINGIESQPTKNAPKMPGSPHPSCFLTQKDLLFQLEQGSFLAGHPESGLKKKTVVMDRVRALLSGVKKELEDFARENETRVLEKEGKWPRRLEIPKNVLDVMKTMGMMDVDKKGCNKQGAEPHVHLEGVSDVTNTHVRDLRGSGISVVNSRDKMGTESTKKQNKRSENLLVDLSPSPDQTEKGPLAISDGHDSVKPETSGMSGPGGPSNHHSYTTRKCQPESCHPDLAFLASLPGPDQSAWDNPPGAPVGANSHRSLQSVDQSGLDRISRRPPSRQGLLGTAPSSASNSPAKTSPVTAYQRPEPQLFQGCSGVCLTQSHGHASQLVPPSGTTSGRSGTPLIQDSRRNVSQKPVLHSQSLSSSSTQAPSRPFRNGPQHLMEGKEGEKKLLELLKQKEVSRLCPSGKDSQLLELVDQKEISRLSPSGKDSQLLELVDQKEISRLCPSGKDSQLLELVDQKEISRLSPSGKDSQLLELMDQKKISRLSPSGKDSQLLELVDQKEISRLSPSGKDSLLLELVDQKEISRLSSSGKGTEDLPSHVCQKTDVLGSSNQSSLSPQEDKELTYTEPERWKAAFEKEVTDGLPTGDDESWKEFGKANCQFLDRKNEEEAEPTDAKSCQTARAVNDHTLRCSSHVVTSPCSPMALEKGATEMALRKTSKESADVGLTIPATVSDATDSATERRSPHSSVFGKQSPESKPSTPGVLSPPQPSSSCGVGRGRGAISPALLHSLQMSPANNRDDRKTPDRDSVPRGSPNLARGRGCGLAMLKLLRK